MLEKLKELVYYYGLMGNCFVPIRNDESHNYEIGRSFEISHIIINEGRDIILRGRKNGGNGNSISLRNARLIYTEEGIRNLFNAVNTLQEGLQAFKDQFTGIEKEMKDRNLKTYDTKTIKMEQMVEMLKSQDVSPQEIVAKLFSAYEL